MSDPPGYAFYDPPPDHRSRRGHIIIGGILFGLAGLFFVAIGGIYLVLPMMGALAGGGSEFEEVFGEMPFFEMMAVSGGILFLYGLVGCVAAIGSLMLKRWCRVLCLTLAGMLLYIGVIQLLSTVMVFPAMMEAMMSMEELDTSTAGGPGAPSMDMMLGVQLAIQVGFGLIFYVAIPALMMWFYWGRHAIDTLELSDQKERWTDRCPAPVLAVVWVALLMAPVSLGVLPFAKFLPELIGGGLSTAMIVVASLVGFVVLLYIAWGSYRQQLFAWVCSMAAVLVWSASSFYFVTQVEYDAMLDPSNAFFQSVTGEMTEEEKAEVEEGFGEMNEMMGTMMESMRNPLTIITVVSVLPILGYLIWVFRYYRKSASPTRELSAG